MCDDLVIFAYRRINLYFLNLLYLLEDKQAGAPGAEFVFCNGIQNRMIICNIILPPQTRTRNYVAVFYTGFNPEIRQVNITEFLQD